MTASESDLDARIARLDLEQKVRLLTGASFLSLTGEPDIGLPPIGMSDGPVGVKGFSMSGGQPTACLPNASTLAASWSVDVLERAGAILAQEALRQHIHLVLGPTINLHRTPLGGRLFEAYSEDPLLSGLLAAGYVRGMQAHGVAACLKHLIVNDSETDRHGVDVRVDEAVLRELYLLPFEIAIADADAWSVMTSYNRVNGVPASENAEIVRGILKGEWGYDGLVVSDFFSVHSTAESAQNGLDILLPGPDGAWGARLVEAVRAGAVPEEVIDDHVRRLLRLAGRTGRLDAPTPRSVVAPTSVDRDELVRMAVAGMTVLKNDGMLPLAPSTEQTLVGIPAWETLLMGGGSPEVTTPAAATLVEALRERSPGLRVARGVELGDAPPPARAGFVVDPVSGQPGMRFELSSPEGVVLRDEHVADAKRYVGLAGETDEPGRRVRLRARIDDEGPLQLAVAGLGEWTVRAGADDERFTLDPVSGMPGEGMLAPPRRYVLAGASGPLEIEAELALGTDVVRTLTYLVARPAPVPDDAAIAAAVEAARSRDAIVVVGVTSAEEAESQDKSTLRLPGAQDRLVSAVAAVARRTVVVVNSATPVLMPWADEVDAILVVGLPGQEGGQAIAAALFGEHEPSGRLTTSWPQADGASPAWEVVPTDGVLEYSEGVFIGYRGFAQGAAPAPAHWFGEGLGFGTWHYSDAVPTAGELPGVAVTIANTGVHPSREVVQLYFAPDDERQPTRLVGWAAAIVAPGESTVVTVESDPRGWRRWSAQKHAWEPLARTGELLVARGLGDIRARLRIG